jgi:hypothetical protein
MESNVASSGVGPTARARKCTVCLLFVTGLFEHAIDEFAFRSRIYSLEEHIMEMSKQTKKDVHDLKSRLPEFVLALYAKIDLIHREVTQSEEDVHITMQRIQENRMDLLERISNMVPRQELISAREEARSSLENAELLSHQAAKQRETASALSDRLSQLQEQHGAWSAQVSVEPSQIGNAHDLDGSRDGNHTRRRSSRSCGESRRLST